MTQRPRFGKAKKPKLKEGPILQHVLSYLEWEHIWRMRVHCGMARVGGRPFKIPLDLIRSLLEIHPDLKDGKKQRCDWMIRSNEQWAPLAPEGTPDIVLMIPARRTVTNPWTLEREVVAYARIGFIETKATDGRMREEQKKFAALCEAQGALYWKINDVEELRRMIPPKMELGFY